MRRTVVIGAGIGGLAASVRLAHAGHEVLVLEMASHAGGKLRALPSAAGPVDAGPTVFTLKPRFDALFEAVGERLENHIDLVSEPLLARHWWPDGSSLDLFADPEASAAAVRAFAGPRGEREFRGFCARAKRLFDAFEAPIMQSPEPRIGPVIAQCMTNLRLMRDMTPPRTLWQALSRQFSDPRLAQLFARYATYVGGSPFESPDILSLIWHAEASGVWRVRGGMVRLAEALEKLARARGAQFRYDARVSEIRPRAGQAFEIELAGGDVLTADTVLFNGDPAGLKNGLLGDGVSDAVTFSAVEPRSLSAYVWAFAAIPSGVELAHHNVFFNTHYRREFAAIANGQMPKDAALYVCAQDRGDSLSPEGLERFEIILNGPPTSPGQDLAAQDLAAQDLAAQDLVEQDLTGQEMAGKEYETCTTVTFETLARMGLRFSPSPERTALTTPKGFAKLHPGSAGSLYGRSPHGMTATFRRPVVRSAIPGLFLAGGGVHPGAGLPMAMTSGLHAAEAILTDHASISRSLRTVMPGGTSTGYPTAEPAVSRSSHS